MQTLILDSSQISAWSECPTIWANRGLIAIDKLDPSKTLRPKDALAAGTLGHKYLEIYYTALAQTGDPDVAAIRAASFDPDAEDNSEEQYPLDQKIRDKVKARVIDYFTMYRNGDYKPACRPKHEIRVRDGILVDATVRDPLIEKGFSFKLYESPEYLFVLEGRIDFVGESQDGTVFFLDHKFQFREHTLYSKAIQFRNYALATGLNLGIVNYIRLHDTLGPRTFVRQPLSFSSLEMRHWKEELIEIYVRIAKQVAAGEFPKNRNSCAGSWGTPCQFTPLCEEYNATTREAIRRRDFTERKEWRPW